MTDEEKGIYILAYVEANGQEPATLAVLERWAEETYPEDFKDIDGVVYE